MVTMDSRNFGSAPVHCSISALFSSLLLSWIPISRWETNLAHLRTRPRSNFRIYWMLLIFIPVNSDISIVRHLSIARVLRTAWIFSSDLPVHTFAMWGKSMMHTHPPLKALYQNWILEQLRLLTPQASLILAQVSFNVFPNFTQKSTLIRC